MRECKLCLKPTWIADAWHCKEHSLERYERTLAGATPEEWAKAYASFDRRLA